MTAIRLNADAAGFAFKDFEGDSLRGFALVKGNQLPMDPLGPEPKMVMIQRSAPAANDATVASGKTATFGGMANHSSHLMTLGM